MLILSSVIMIILITLVEKKKMFNICQKWLTQFSYLKLSYG